MQARRGREEVIEPGTQVFVTDAYKKRLEELKKKEKQEDVDNEVQGDMSAFYRRVLDGKAMGVDESQSVDDVQPSVEKLVPDLTTAPESASTLVGGLNVKPAYALARQQQQQLAHKSTTSKHIAFRARDIEEKRKRALDIQRQKQEVSDRKKMQAEAELDMVKETLKSKADDGAVDDARARYLARKRKKQMEDGDSDSSD